MAAAIHTNPSSDAHPSRGPFLHRLGVQRHAPLQLLSLFVLSMLVGCHAGGSFKSTVTEATFDQEVLQSDELVMVDFGATWCGPCHMMEPILKDLAEDYQGRVKIEAVDVEESPSLARQYSIEAMPTFVFIRNGQEVGRKLGADSYDAMRAALEAHLAAGPSPSS